jgi:FAD/FMN-containing dehydrogenase
MTLADHVQLSEDLARIAVRPDHPDYDGVRGTFAATGSPDVVLRVTTPEEVAAGIALAAVGGRPLSVRSGGHSAPGFGTNDGGVVIDLSSFDEVEVLDVATRRVRVGAGATWGAVAEALGPHGLAISSGDTRSVGVGGLALAGGMGWMVRRYGLTLDNLRAAEVVTVDGRVLRASADEYPDLFWALRGGGGNFGVVTRLELEAAPVSSVVAGVVSFGADAVDALLRGYRDVMRAAPDELTTTLVLAPGLGGRPPGASVLCCWADDDEDAAAAAIAPLRALGTPVSADIRLRAYADVLEEAQPPPGLRGIVSNALFRSLDDDALDAVAAVYGGGESGRVVVVRWLGGAMSQVPAETTAWGHRDVEAMVVHLGFVPIDASDDQVSAVVGAGAAIEALGCGAYAGFLSSASAGDVARMFPPATLARLREVKRCYDPDNVLRLNYNVEPADRS